ncbi:MAG: exodeoxyribonuclease VII small subunit [Alphaproteobacteria bacterium]|nr:exodeoxyribonuclease VII small subunit [Alphaproteobacteria bacterium]
MESTEDAASGRSFEHALTELEDHVRKLDSGELPLEEALALFERGVALVKECHELLDGAERRIVEVTRGMDGLQEAPFDGGSRGADDRDG